MAPSLLLSKLRGTDVVAAQLDVEDPLHVAEDLLVGLGGAALEVGDDGGGGVAAGGEVLLGHLGLGGLAGLGDGGADVLADGVGLDDVVGAVDLREALALGAALGGLDGILVSTASAHCSSGLVARGVVGGCGDRGTGGGEGGEGK